MVKEDGSRRADSVVLDINMAIEELHKFSPHEMKKILQDTHCLSFRVSSTTKGAIVSVDIEKLATFLPLHLLACVASSISQPRFRYLLRGVRLLHSLSNLAPRYPKLEQILLQEVKIREQIIDLVIFMLIVLADVEPDGRWGSFLAVLHSALVACCLYLLTAFVTPEWRDVAPVLLAHPKVDIFMDAAFDAVRRDIGLLQGRFKALSAKLAKEKTPPLCGAEQVSSTTLEHCEASLQVLQALSEPQAFRDRLLNHKELCKNGGILSLVLVVLQLQLPSHLQHIQALSASISRVKSKVLAMLLKFCETETVSFLDEVATDPKSMQLAKMVAAEIVLLVKNAFFETFTVQMVQEDIEKCPAGMLYLNAMRLADVLSDDSNFRNFFMDRIAPDLATILAMDPSEFCSKWCGGCSAQDMADCEIDATLVYDPFHGSGAAMLSFKPSPGTSEEGNSGCSLSIKPVEPTFYAQELSALLVKLFANLHCFNPEVCPADEKDRFLCLFMRCLSAGPLSPLSSSFFMTSDQTAVRVCENLHILVDHVASLPSDLANDEDVQLASVFAAELHEAFCLSPDVHADAPVVTYVRDAHEQRLGAIVARRVPSERWQRLQREMEQNIPECDPHILPAHEETTPLHVPEEASSAVDSKADVNVDVKLQEDEGPQSGVQSGVKVEEECVSARESDAKDLPVKTELDEVVMKTDTEVKEPDEVAPKVEEEPKEDIKTSVTNVPIIDPLPVIEPLPEPTVLVHPSGLQAATPVIERPPERLLPPRPPQVQVEPQQNHPAAVEERERISLIRKHEDEARADHHHMEQPRKRQRRIMSEQQIAVMEAALKEEPEMQRYAERVRHWSIILNKMGPEITTGQLKNWINNRKAKLAKLAKEGRLDPAVVNRPKPCYVSSSNFEEPPVIEEDLHHRTAYNNNVSHRPEPPVIEMEPSVTQIGQNVVLKDELGREIAYGITKAVTPGEEGAVAMCLVEIVDLKVDRGTKLPIGSDFMGTTFDEAEKKLGKLIVAWPSNNVRLRL
ncbi:nodulin homeobox [Selaginella moellendorffii]|uniref:nodulin homeobox n=1 Tax=Selaginella moellendorffii TaxID=88036 RepID=UPI000D1C5053|nr:nodulin homeobox [Selaginella moellendorffii]XP_024545755.1 nodulin homeobox [Selaginella moellendorffii]|eukprot:XP_024545754.1 nodulin homeobox [Selaginella moellendorffii]